MDALAVVALELTRHAGEWTAIGWFIETISTVVLFHVKMIC
jgi:hypothetical protein